MTDTSKVPPPKSKTNKLDLASEDVFFWKGKWGCSDDKRIYIYNYDDDDDGDDNDGGDDDDDEDIYIYIQTYL